MRLRFQRSTVRRVGSLGAALLALACGGGVSPSAEAIGTAGTSMVSGTGLGGGGGTGVSSSTGGSAVSGTGGSSPDNLAGAGPALGGGTNLPTGVGGSPPVAGMGTGGNPMSGVAGMAGNAAGGEGGSTGGTDGIAGAGGDDGSSGGSSGSGGTNEGGSGGTSEGGSGEGGEGSGGEGAAGAGNVPDIGPGPCGCEQPAGEFGTVNATIVVGSGQVYDGECQIFRANPSTLGAGNQDEGQLPIFRIENGGTLRNIVIDTSGADGIHTYGDVTMENIHWLDIGEDAMTVKESGTVELDCGSSAHGDDKTFQVNAASDIFISNFTATDAGKFMRQNGDTTFQVTVTIDHCDISSMDESIFRTDSSTSHVTLTNTRYSDIGDGLFIFGDSIVDGNSGQSTVSNNEEY